MKNRKILKKKSQHFNDPYANAPLPLKSVRLKKINLFPTDANHAPQQEPLKNDDMCLIDTQFGIKHEGLDDSFSNIEMDIKAKINQEMPTQAIKKPKDDNSEINDFLGEAIAINFWQDFTTKQVETLEEYPDIRDPNQIVITRNKSIQCDPTPLQIKLDSQINSILSKKEKPKLTCQTLDISTQRKKPNMSFSTIDLNVPKSMKNLSLSLKTCEISLAKKAQNLTCKIFDYNIPKTKKIIPLTFNTKDILIHKKAPALSFQTNDLNISKKEPNNTLAFNTCEISILEKDPAQKYNSYVHYTFKIFRVFI